MTSTEPRDIIDLLAGIKPGSHLDSIRARRLQARENAQKSYVALFEPADVAEVSAAERYAVAGFVAGLHEEPSTKSFYLAKLADASGDVRLADAIKAEVERGRTQGPYGAFPAGPLSVEDRVGLIYRATPDARSVLGPKLAVALEQAHLLVFRPRDASSAAMQALLDAGWSTTAIVTLSQLVAFLSFQIRTVAGLKTLEASLGHRAQPADEAGQGAHAR
jgi:CMD domain protein